MANFERNAYIAADERLKKDAIVVEAPELKEPGIDKVPKFRFKRYVTVGDLASYMDGARHGISPEALCFALLWVDEDGNPMVEGNVVTDIHGNKTQEPTWFEKVDCLAAIAIVRRGDVLSQTFGRLSEKIKPLLADGETPEDEKKSPSEN